MKFNSSEISFPHCKILSSLSSSEMKCYQCELGYHLNMYGFCE